LAGDRVEWTLAMAAGREGRSVAADALLRLAGTGPEPVDHAAFGATMA
jgi:hypothetical protein